MAGVKNVYKTVVSMCIMSESVYIAVGDIVL